MKFLVTIALATFAYVSSQWGTVQCAPVGVTYHGWYKSEGDNKAELWWRGEKVGVLNVCTNEWITEGKATPIQLRATFAKTPISKGHCCCNGKCKPICDCRTGCPGECDAGCGCGKDGCGKKADNLPATEGRNFGVSSDRLKKDGSECYCINGVDVGREVAFAMLTGGVPDDSKAQRVVVVGSQDSRTKVLNDWSRSAELKPFTDKAILQCYPPTHWHAQDAGYKAIGEPSIYITDATGKVLHRQDYYDGPMSLSRALRKADPNYDPSKDPDLNKPVAPLVKPPDGGGGGPTPPSPIHPFAALAVVGALVGSAYAYSKRRQLQSVKAVA